MSVGLMPKKFQDKLTNIPQHLQYSNSHKSLKYGELLAAIGTMDKEKAITFDIGEFHREYGKFGKSSLRAFAKTVKNLPFILRIVEDKDNGTILLFKNDKLKT